MRRTDPWDHKELRELERAGLLNQAGTCRIVNLLIFPDSADTSEVERQLMGDGWDVDSSPEFGHVGAEREDVPITAEYVHQMRAYFEALAASVPGGWYEDWYTVATQKR